MISDAILLPFFWLFTFAFISGVGFICIPFKSQSGSLSKSLFTYFWFGLGIIVAFLQVWNLFLPINIYCWITLLPFAGYGLITFKNVTVKKIEKPTGIVLVLCITVLLFLLISSLDNSFIYDTRVYHFYSIKWFSHYPVTPGMGNLLIYLGFNHSYFLYASFLNGLWGGYKGACSTNGLLAIVICSEIILSNAKFILKKEKLTFHAIFQLLFLPLCINVGAQNLSSPTPDVFNNLLAFRLMSDLIFCIEEKEINFQDIFIMGFYCAYGVAMKLSTVSIGLGMSVLLIIVGLKKNLWNYKNTCIAFGYWGLIIIPYLLRSIISSGYLIFPSSFVSFPVDWKVPAKAMADNYDYTIGFARTLKHGPEANLAAHNYSWIAGWVVHIIKIPSFIVPLILFFISSILLKIKKISISKVYFIYIPLIIAIMFWLSTAPDIRFATFIFWSIGLIAMAWLLFNLKNKWIKQLPIIILTCTLLIMIRNWNFDLEPLGDLHPPSLDIFTTKSGLKIYKVKNGNDIYDLNDCTIPCSFQPIDSNLMMRGNTIKKGFKIAR